MVPSDFTFLAARPRRPGWAGRAGLAGGLAGQGRAGAPDRPAEKCPLARTPPPPPVRQLDFSDRSDFSHWL